MSLDETDWFHERFFVVGTDTGIGKTVASATLTVGLRARYWKPVQTGTIEGSDSLFVAEFLPSGSIEREAYSFPEPASPHLAAARDGGVIELSKCIEAFHAIPEGPLVMEGAGGVLVPLNERHLLIDLVAALEVPAIIVTSLRLGTINHTLLTVEALKTRRIPIAGLILNGCGDPDVASTLTGLSGVPLLGSIPQLSQFSRNIFQEVFDGFRLSSR